MPRPFTFQRDADDRLRKIMDGATTRLDAGCSGDGLRVTKTENWPGLPGAPLSHTYSWGPGGVVHDTAGGGSGTVYTPGLAQRVNTTETFFHTDWLGSTRYLSGSTGAWPFPSKLTYDAFGNRSTTTGAFHPSDFQFAGAWGYQQEWSSSTEPGLGLQYLQQRYYDPAVGRFISPDPIGFLGGLNLYGYVANDPANGLDPSGLDDGDHVLSDDVRGRQPAARALLPAISQGAGYARTTLEVGSSFNAGANLAMAVNDAGSGNWGSAALRMTGPASKPLSALLGRAGGFFSTLFMRGRAGGRAVGGLSKAASTATKLVGGNGDDAWVTLYRAVGPNEMKDIAGQGALRAGSGSLQGKWLATTAEDAAEWGRRMNWGWDKEPFDVVPVRVPRGVLGNMMHKPKLDGIGPAYYANPNQLQHLRPAPPLTSLPIRR